MATDNQLITKYRPNTFESVVGNELLIKSLAEAVRGNGPPHGYLITGITGIGKTTLARIIAKETNSFIIERDAASTSGVDDVRQMIMDSGFKSIMGSKYKNKLYILDECHNFSKKAFEPILKWIEDAPDYLFVVLCTTEPSTLPKTIVNRCFSVPLKPLKSQEIEELVTVISEMEGWTLTNDVFSAIVNASEGSARKALAILQSGHKMQTRDELASVVVEVETEDSPVFALSNFLMRGSRDWGQISKILAKIEEKVDDYEIASTQLNASFAREMTKANGQAERAWQMMNCFTSITSWDPKVKFLTALGRIVFPQR